MNPSAGEPASELLARLSEAQLAAVLTENADEAHAALTLIPREAYRAISFFCRTRHLEPVAATIDDPLVRQ